MNNETFRSPVLTALELRHGAGNTSEADLQRIHAQALFNMVMDALFEGAFDFPTPPAQSYAGGRYH
jgi:hypothetical protein